MCRLYYIYLVKINESEPESEWIFFGTRQTSTGTQSFRKQNDATNAHKTPAMMSEFKTVVSHICCTPVKITGVCSRNNNLPMITAAGVCVICCEIYWHSLQLFTVEIDPWLPLPADPWLPLPADPWLPLPADPWLPLPAARQTPESSHSSTCLYGNYHLASRGGGMKGRKTHGITPALVGLTQQQTNGCNRSWRID